MWRRPRVSSGRERLVDDAGHPGRPGTRPACTRALQAAVFVLCQQAINSRWPSGSAGSPFSRTNSSVSSDAMRSFRRRSTASRAPDSDQRTGSPSCAKVSLNAGRCPALSVREHAVAVEEQRRHQRLRLCAPCRRSRRSACAQWPSPARHRSRSSAGKGDRACRVGLQVLAEESTKAIFRAVEMFTLAQPRAMRSLNCSGDGPVPPCSTQEIGRRSTISVTRSGVSLGLDAQSPCAFPMAGANA